VENTTRMDSLVGARQERTLHVVDLVRQLAMGALWLQATRATWRLSL